MTEIQNQRAGIYSHFGILVELLLAYTNLLRDRVIYGNVVELVL